MVIARLGGISGSGFLGDSGPGSGGQDCQTAAGEQGRCSSSRPLLLKDGSQGGIR